MSEEETNTNPSMNPSTATVPPELPPKHAKESIHIGLDSINIKSILDYLLVIISMVLSVVLIFVVAVPQFKKVSEIRKESAAVQIKLETAKVRQSYLESLSALKDQLDKNILVSRQAVPVESDVPYFLNQLVQMARDSSLHINAQTFTGVSAVAATKVVGAPVPDNKAADLVIGDPDAILGTDGIPQAPPVKASELVVNMEVVGRYEDLIKFSALVEDTRRIVRTKTVEITLLEKDASTATSEEEDPLVTEFGSDAILYTAKYTFAGYFLSEIDTSTLGIDTLVNKTNLEGVVARLEKLKYYEPEIFNVEIGKFNPFVNEDAGISTTSEPTTLTVPVEPATPIEPQL